MLYTTFEAGNKEYKLRLNTRNVVELEKRIGCNPLNIFNADTVPTVSVMVAVLHASLQQYQHNISINETYDIFDAYLADGNDITKFIYVILEVYKASGLISNEVDTEEKN